MYLKQLTVFLENRERCVPKNVMMPAMAKGRHVFVEKRLKDMAEDACTLPINKVEMNDTKIGVITYIQN